MNLFSIDVSDYQPHRRDNTYYIGVTYVRTDSENRIF